MISASKSYCFLFLESPTKSGVFGSILASKRTKSMPFDVKKFDSVPSGSCTAIDLGDTDKPSALKTLKFSTLLLNFFSPSNNVNCT